MASFFSRILGGLTGKPAGEESPAEPERGEAVHYEGFVIQAAPERDGSQWRLAGVIIKTGDAGDLERSFLRADTFASREEAESFAVRKAKQIIDEQGERLFADGAPTGRA